MFESTIVVPIEARSSGATAFTEPCVATGMKAGVGTRPSGVSMLPALAGPSVHSTRKLKGMGGSSPCEVAGWLVGRYPKYRAGSHRIEAVLT